MKKITLLSISYCFVLILLFLYSYTQVDLDLTFSRFPLLHTIIKSMQYIGYFQRPLATLFYIIIVILLFIFYLVFLRLVKRKEITRKQLWMLIFGTALVLVCSYNALSYDLFNYIFDAKIFTYYHQNPYLHKALDYPHDPMLTFMRWTHRTYPYGPVWLFITIPLSFLGAQFFIPTFFLFKTLAAVSYVGSAYFIEKISQKVEKQNSLTSLVFFALNPLVIIECLVSAHLDIAMIVLFLWAFYLFLRNKYYRSFIVFNLSVGIKFATGFLFPVLIYLYFYRKKVDGKLSLSLVVSLILMIVAVIAEIQRSTFQTWYLLIVLPFSALLISKKYIYYPSVIFSFFSLMIYTPFLYFGTYTYPITAMMFWIIIIGIIACIVSFLILYRGYLIVKKV